MSWLHPALLFGLVLTVVPIVLHLLLRARPKRLIFPALRLLQLRNVQNSRRLRLRHFWLLLLRMLVIAGLVLVIARPSFPPADYSLQTREILRLAAVLAFGLATYFALQTWWNRQRLPAHVLRSRRTYLKGGVGLLTALLCALFVIWPYQRRVAAEITNPAPPVPHNVPVAAVFLFDTSASLQYQYEGASRLDDARRIALAHLQSLPSGSKVAVLDGTGELPALFTPDLSAVQNRLESLSIQPAAPALNERLRAASRLQEDDRRRTMSEQAGVAEAQQQDKFVREIYLFTDLARSAWREDSTHLQKEELAATPWMGLYLIDVGVEAPMNVGFVKAAPARPAIASGGVLTVEGTLRSLGPVRPEQAVEFWLQIDDKPPTKRDQQTVSLQEGSEAGVQFRLENVTGKLAQGELRLVTADPLSFDNTAAFTVRLLPPLEVLVVADERAQTQFWLEALNDLNLAGTAYKPTMMLTSQLRTANLEKFDIVCLLNVARPTNELWTKLKDFVENGGGLTVCLGAASTASAGANLSPAEFAKRLDPITYQGEAPSALLPGKLKAQLPFSPSRQLQFRGTNHPLVTRLETLGVLAALNDVDFYRYWSIEPDPAATVLARWNHDSAPPALMFREVGRGRSLLFATSVDSAAWNGLRSHWTFLVLIDQMMQLLSRQANSSLNYTVGDPVTVPLPPNSPTGPALLRAPDLTQVRVEIPQDARDLSLPPVTAVGQYQILSTKKQPPALVAGFSVRPLATESDLTRLTKDDLDTMFGEKRYGLSRDPQQLARSVTTGRLGQEVYGVVLALLIVFFFTEQATATWFYRTDES